ncbi:MAG: alginate export family protein [Verrucomicrobiales bacterium]|nr:alginate export family protein [Verrucomicrobiales bacterium]
MTHTTIVAALALCFAASFGQAGEISGKGLVLNDKVPSLVKVSLDTRFRYEYGDQSGLAPSHAATVRNRLGLLTREMNGFQGYVEYEGTIAADRFDYNDATARAPGGKTIIADPTSQELNQAWISYKDPNGLLAIKGGRQAINLDGQRYVGTVGWRQNMQTFDAATLTLTPNDDLEIFYGYVWQVNRIFGSNNLNPGGTDFKGETHLFNAKFKNLPVGTLTTYVYSMDLKNVAGAANSNNSFGLSLSGDFIGDTQYYAEYGYQTDAYDNPLNYNASYAHANISGKVGSAVTTTVGYEYLGSDNGVGYKFPLATLHKFNGFADRFLGTPAGGLSDMYLSAATSVAGVKFVAAYHYFWDDGFDVALGQEVDLVASKALNEKVSVLAKGAFFMGQGAQPDVTRASVEMNIAY